MSAEPVIQNPPPTTSGKSLFDIFRPAPPAVTLLTEPAKIEATYRVWQTRVLFFSIAGYATFYFVRKNLGVAMPLMGKELGITKTDLGLFLTLHGVIYGVSKFLNGFLADRSNARVFMAVALMASALLNVAFGSSSSVMAFGIIWMANGWFQGMGFPPCARLIANWFPPKQLATKFSIWNSSHNIGSIGVLLLCGFLVSGKLFAANWRLCFFVPAAVAVIIAMVLWFKLPDTPPSVGLPEFEGTQVEIPDKKSQEDFKAFVFKQVFCNKYIWLLSAANFFVYAIRYAVFDWGPTMLTEAKHIPIFNAAVMLSCFEAFGLIGALLGGWLTDRYLGGRAARACVIYMALACVSVLLFWKIQTQSQLLITGLLCATGFFVYGPQCLLAIACANLATKRAAATAVGLTSIFGYASTTLSGWGLGFVVQHYGWNVGFAGLIGCALAGTLLFICAWPAKADGYGA
ncbi:MAG TPA: MFS transporter [Verrucomicrobiae bacterium]|jgi:OPA family glycerol-3-phosphate transporter-like MFS transporter/OPA family sugar phosphate sensor protein UhpC-like MFS transporter|nr:MFS transporter [Verrucomicrobiae bacterium]